MCHALPGVQCGDCGLAPVNPLRGRLVHRVSCSTTMLSSWSLSVSPRVPRTDRMPRHRRRRRPRRHRPRPRSTLRPAPIFTALQAAPHRRPSASRSRRTISLQCASTTVPPVPTSEAIRRRGLQGLCPARARPAKRRTESFPINLPRRTEPRQYPRFRLLLGALVALRQSQRGRPLSPASPKSRDGHGLLHHCGARCARVVVPAGGAADVNSEPASRRVAASCGLLCFAA